jgi:cyanophycinase
MSRKVKGPLIIIGGHEETREGCDRVILKEVARPATKQKGRLVVVTVATHLPEELGDDYVKAFKSLGVHHVDVLDIRTRDEAYSAEALRKLAGASVIFFTGGDQLRITSQLGGSPVLKRMLEIHDHGGTIAGTSAGAAAVPDTMLISGRPEHSPTVASLGMAPGLGLLKGFIVDSHFAERGRIGRLLGAVSHNPQNLGLGIDENTAVVVEDERTFRVIGSGAVCVIDGRAISYTSLSEKNPEGTLSIFDIKLHLLAERDAFDLTTGKPVVPEEALVESSSTSPRRNGDEKC